MLNVPWERLTLAVKISSMYLLNGIEAGSMGG